MSSKEVVQKIFERSMTDAKDVIDSLLYEKLSESLLSLNEKKLDPVGKEDGDIDNDGDEDDTDSYLANRRRAIGKAMKKEDMQYEEKMGRLDSRGLGVKRQSGLGKPTKRENEEEGTEKKKTNESLKLDEVDLSHQSAHDHNETEAREKKVGVGKVHRAKGGSY
jgi:hypothetical protein